MTEVVPYDDGHMQEEFPNSPSETINNVVKLETFRKGNVFLMISYRRMYSPLHSSGHLYGSFDTEDFTYNNATATFLYKLISDSEQINHNDLQKQVLIRLWRDDILSNVISTGDDLHLALTEKKGIYECKIHWNYMENQRVDSIETLIEVSGKLREFIIDSIDGETLGFDVLSSDESEELDEYSSNDDDFNETDDSIEDKED